MFINLRYLGSKAVTAMFSGENGGTTFGENPNRVIVEKAKQQQSESRPTFENVIRRKGG